VALAGVVWLSAAAGASADSAVLAAAVRRARRRLRRRLVLPVLVFSVAVIEEFAFCPGAFPARAEKSKQKAEAARTNAKSKLLKRTIFMLMN